MGKPYESELNQLEYTYSWALLEDIDELKEVLTSFCEIPLLAVGSGGSYTAAVFLEKLHSNAGFLSKSITPYDYIVADCKNVQSGVFLFSASGNNTDALNTFEISRKMGTKFFVSLCMNKNSKLMKLPNDKECSKIICYDVPTKKDGFLATNSLLASIVLLLRVYQKFGQYAFTLPPKEFFFSGKHSFGDELKCFLERKTWIVLYGNWSKAGALDLESKAIEAGLRNVQLADYRNFAHGRHHWTAKNLMDTAVIAFATPEEEVFAKDILNCLPNNMPKSCIVSQKDGPLGALELVLSSYYIIAELGRSLNIDPGKPGVPKYGEKLYSMDCTNYTIRDWGNKEYPLLQKELVSYDKLIKASNAYKGKICSVRFGAVVFDYDGTLCGSTDRYNGISPEITDKLIELASNEIYIGVATGRGQSVREVLQSAIPKKLWENFYIGYYNGATIAPLSNSIEPDKSLPLHPELKKVSLCIKSDKNLDILVNCEERPKQLTIEVKDKKVSGKIVHYLQEMINIRRLDKVKLVTSSHSIDIIPSEVSKLELVNKFSKLLNDKKYTHKVLCIGDRGRWPGNDCELLSHSYSLSVDQVSNSLNSCWNFSSQCNEKGVIEYLNKIIIKPYYFAFNFWSVE